MTHLIRNGSIVEPTAAEMMAAIRALQENQAKLEAENAALRASKSQGEISLKINDQPWTDAKGKAHPAPYSLSLWGLSGRKPLTLKKAGWQQLAEFMPTLLAFIKKHENDLS